MSDEHSGVQTCFVDMPFGQKMDLKSGVEIDFDQIFESAIRPGVEQAGLQCIRGDQESTGGLIHEAMFARLLLSEFVVADMTTANANVFYELGIRHAAKPYTTIPIFATLGAPPFDVNMIRAIPYALDGGQIAQAAAAELATQIEKRIRNALDSPVSDSPIYQLFKGYPTIELSHEMTDVFDDRIRVSEDFQRKLDTALQSEPKGEALTRVCALEASLGDMRVRGRETLMKLFLAYRDLEAFQEMLDLYDGFPGELKHSEIARQQRAFALNRRDEPGDKDEAIRTLEKLRTERGDSAETGGLLGRIYKDLFRAAKKADDFAADGYLDEAIAAYTRGFESEPADYYPGVNAINLLIQKGTPNALQEVDRLAPLVSFAVARRGGAASEDYWDLATVLELAVAGRQYDDAMAVAPKVLAKAKAGWMLDTTGGNLAMLLELRPDEDTAKLEKILGALKKKAGELSGAKASQ